MKKLSYFSLCLSLVILLTLAGSAAASQSLRDMAGRQVTIKGPVNRIITTFKPASLMAFCLGLQHKLVGMDNSSRKDPLLKAIYPDVINLPGVGKKQTGLNFETLVTLEPDLVILYSQKDGLNLAKRLKQVNIASIVIVPESFESIKKAMVIISRAAGTYDPDIPVFTQMDKILDILDQRLSSLDIRKTGYFASPSGLFSTATGSMLQTQILNRAGVDNVAGHLKGFFQDISPEQLIQWNPDIIILSMHMKDNGINQLNMIPMKQITAVAKQSVFRCPSSLAPWDFPSPLSVLAALWLAKTVYPENFMDVDFEAATDEFHRVLFNRTFTQMGGRLNDKLIF